MTIGVLDTNSQCGFLRIAPELRNRIYKSVFAGSDLHIRQNSGDDAHIPRTRLTLLQTCCQVYQEAKTIPYYACRLHFASATSFYQFTTELTIDKIGAIRRVTIYIGNQYSLSEVGRGVASRQQGDWFKEIFSRIVAERRYHLRLLHLLPNLEEVTIELNHLTVTDFSDDKDHEGDVTTAIGTLRGLSKLEVTLCIEEDDEDSDDGNVCTRDLGYMMYIHDHVTRLESAWSQLATRSKIFSS